MKIVSTTYYPEFPAWTMPEWAAEELRTRFPGFEVVRFTSNEGVLEQLADADILFCWSVRSEQIAAAKNLKWIHTGMAGVNWILIPEVVAGNILVSNSKGVHAIPIAEHTMALMLQFSRRLVDCLDDQRQGLWRRRDRWESAASFDELYNKTVGVIGIGTLGTEIAKRAKAFGMRVIGVKKDVATVPPNVDLLFPPDKLDDALPQMDYVVIAAPSTPETRGMIGREQLDRMKKSAVLVNMARGELVDQDALIRAMNDERIAGAALDVFVPDPLPEGHPLFFTKNVIITPHISGVSRMLWRRIMDLWFGNIERFLQGRELINQVDKQRGY